MAGEEDPLTARLNPFRAVPPVHSPIRPGAVLRAAIAPDRGAPEQLRRLLADRYHADEVVLTDSGTHALQLALDYLCRATGRDGVALPAFTCYDVATAGAGAASRLEFYDIDPDTLQPDPASFDAAVATGVAAAVIVHHYGIPVDPEPWARRARAHDAVLLEDAAQGHGGSHDGRPLGALAPYSVLSFGRGKGWTGGGGGALLLRGHAVGAATKTRVMLEPGAAPAALPAATKLFAQWALARPSLYGLPSRLPFLGLGETVYRAPTPPRVMSPAAAGIVLATAEAADAEARVRRERARRLRDALADTPGLWLPPGADGAGYLRLPLRVPGRAADDVVGGRLRTLGVLPSYPRALPTLPQIGELRGAERGWGGAEMLAREVFTAPVHSLADRASVSRVVQHIRELQVDDTGTR